jgi:hypothetical protein
MVGDGIKAARIQPRYSPLIGLTWEPVSFPVNVAAALKNATTRLNPHRGRRPAGRHAASGRHAAPGRSFLGRPAAQPSPPGSEPAP